jgi:hypothetical protein
VSGLRRKGAASRNMDKWRRFGIGGGHQVEEQVEED